MDPAQKLARRYTVVHNLLYYCPEIRDFAAAGIKGWWHAYFHYRAAPMGPVPPEVVGATFYNFAPAMIAKAFPHGWSILSPQQALDLRNSCVDRALRRVLGADIAASTLAEAAALAQQAIAGCDVAARPLFAGHSALDWPTEPHLTLWHAATLLREHRGDCHNIALAAADIDGVACHVLMAALGHGNRTSILGIRGWTVEQWAAAVDTLSARGWLNADTRLTEEGRAGRAAIEEHTNRLAAQPCQRLGLDGVSRLCELLDPLVAAFHERGEVPGTWPPPHLLRPDS